MAMAFTIVQLTDPHIGAPWSEDPVGALAEAVAAIRRVLGGAPDAVVVTGDIANNGADGEYALARELLEALGSPLYVLPGNHDDRATLRRHFELPGAEAALVNYVAELGPIRLVVLDTKRDGEASGQLDSARLEWLGGALAEDRATPTLLAMHHPPLLTGLAPMDAIGIPAQDRAALGEVVSRHGQVQLIAAGHVHRTIVGALSRTPILAIPSNDMQTELDFDAAELQLVREPACFAIHVLADRQIVSHVQPIAENRAG
jgi:3',5'-cyclic-AMP phosphodiesterase